MNFNQPEAIKIEVTEKGAYVLPLSLALHEAFPWINILQSLEIAEWLWEREQSWADVIDA